MKSTISNCMPHLSRLCFTWFAIAVVGALVMAAGVGAVGAATPEEIECEAAALTSSDDPLRRSAAVRALAGRVDDEAAGDALADALADRHFHVRWLALRALARHERLAVEHLESALVDAHPQVRGLAALIVRERGLASEVAPTLEAQATGRDPLRAERSLLALSRLDRLTGAVLTQAATADAAQVRRTALVLLADGRARTFDAAALGDALDDTSPAVRALAAEVLVKADALSLEQLEGVLADRVSLVREVGVRALDRLPETHEVRRLRTIVRGMSLPSAGWRFAIDPDQRGEDEAWFDPQFDDAHWQRVEIEQTWGEFGHTDYVGDGWYRREIEVPSELGAAEHLELAFGAVDESARVWVNGHFIGEHDIGPSGWNVPFALEVTDHITPGERNQITVRVWNTRGAGGIWRPVRLRPR